MYLVIVCVFFFSSFAWALDVVPHQFSSDTPAYAASVNQNFSALQDALVAGWTDVDTTAGGTTTSAVATTINSITFTAPSNGAVIVNGSCFVNNQDAAQQEFGLNLLLNGNPINTHAFLADSIAAADGGVDFVQLAYTFAVPVNAGANTFVQILNSDGNSHFYNKNSLTIIFFPSSAITQLSAGNPTGVPGPGVQPLGVQDPGPQTGE